MEWFVEIQGDKSDLRDLAKSLSSPEFCITKDRDNFVLKSTDFEPLTNVDDVRKMSCNLLSLINGAARLALDMRKPLTISAIIQVKDDDTRTISICLSDSITVRSSVSLSILSLNGVVEEINPANPITRWIELAKQDTNVSNVLQLFERGTDWSNLYRIYEVIEKDAGGINKIEEKGWATKRAVKLFKHTSQSPDAIGHDARHGIQKEKAPESPMSFSEAKSLIKMIVHSWLRSKYEER